MNLLKIFQMPFGIKGRKKHIDYLSKNLIFFTLFDHKNLSSLGKEQWTWFRRRNSLLHENTIFVSISCCRISFYLQTLLRSFEKKPLFLQGLIIGKNKGVSGVATLILRLKHITFTEYIQYEDQCKKIFFAISGKMDKRIEFDRVSFSKSPNRAYFFLRSDQFCFSPFGSHCIFCMWLTQTTQLSSPMALSRRE